MSREQLRMERKLLREKRRREKRANAPKRLRESVPEFAQGFLSLRELTDQAAAFFRTCWEFLRYPGRRQSGVTRYGSPVFQLYAVGFITATAAGYIGVLAYFALGGRKYFNPWYLFLMPVLSSLLGLALSLVYTTSARLVWRSNEDRHRRVFFWSLAMLPLVFLPAAWIVFPLRIVFPNWEVPHFFFAAALFVYIAARIVREGLRYYDWKLALPGLLAPGIVYLVALRLTGKAAESVVAALKL